MIQTYKCPSCGGGMTFDGESQMLYCDHCGKKQSIEEYRKEHPLQEESEEQQAKEDALQVFHCPSCGAELITDAYTAATVCGYCGGSVILGSRLDGKETPDAVLPFSISREQAKEKLKAWAKSRHLSPSSFIKNSTLEKISGMYVPYWMYCYDIRAQVQADCTRTRSERRGNTRYVHTDHFKVFREVEAVYERIPADASIKMPDDVMDKLEPFQYHGLKEFEPAYLSGYMAEKFNLSSEQTKNRAEKRAEEYALSLAMESISGYATIRVINKNIDLKLQKTEYALLPVWLLHFHYLGKEHLFTMNGQTGKIIGQLPVSVGKILLWFFGIMAVVFLVVFLIMNMVLI